MTLEEFQEGMERLLSDANARARAEKCVEAADEEMKLLVRTMDPDEREMARNVIIEWTTSSESDRRFMALQLIRAFNIVEARPALLVLIDHLSKDHSVGAPFEIAKTKRLLKYLNHNDGESRPSLVDA